MTNTIAPPTLEELILQIELKENSKNYIAEGLKFLRVIDIELYCLYAVRDSVVVKARNGSPYWICCNCDAPLSCAMCGLEQPDDSEYFEKLARDGIHQDQINPLRKLLADLVEINRRDENGDPDFLATDTWREEAWQNARNALVFHPDGGFAQSPWMDIETAPKDGLIDIWTEGFGADPHRIASCYYDKICGEWRTTCPIGKLLCIGERYVTHWMPIPAPPTHNSTTEEQRCQKCDCVTKGEEVWVNGQIWCHPCAGNVPPIPKDNK